MPSPIQHPLHPLLDVLPEVADALACGAPVVALESTIISHGMPWPDNLATAQAVQSQVREAGAVPATIAVMAGRLRVGLDAAGLQRLARLGPRAHKASRRDLPLLVASGGTGATTVAATMIIAALAGIRVFATGGIGGVHRGAAQTFDISADLQELARTPVAVVCAGIKSILDLPLTLEYLETHGVPLLGYRCDRLPAFFTRDSPWPVDQRLDSPEAVAAVIEAQRQLGYSGGLILANPVPAGQAMPSTTMDAAIERALAEADAAGITGKAITPYLLDRVNVLTGGQSLAANIALILNNARVAAEVAVALAAAPERGGG